MSEESPFVSEPEKKEEPVVNTVVKGGDQGSFRTAALVLTILVVIVILYYAVTCYSSNSKPRKLKNPKKTKVDLDNFDVEKEVQKLRIKQDEFKARL